MVFTSAISAQTTGSSRERVLSAIKQASQKSGVDFSYLLTKANQESGLDASAQSQGSTAKGLYQFIDQTWLKTIKQNGDKYGLSDQAAKITVGSDGVARVASDADRRAILALRNDPEISAEMAAELAKTNKEQLQTEVGGRIGPTEMYLAHFLGAGGASELLNTMKSNPDAKAADLLPQAASANKNVFYDKITGLAKSVRDIYQQFAQKFDKAGETATQLASAISTSTHPTQSAVAQNVASAQKIETAMANEVVQSSSTSGVAVSNGVSLDKTTASPFAAMVLAQMDMDTFGNRALDLASHSPYGQTGDTRRKTALAQLADAA